MESRKMSKILGWFLAMAIMTTGTLTWACHLPRKARYYPNRVNTPIEYRYDANHDGWLGPRERIAMAHYRVDNRWERYCDFNRNGYIDTLRERRCY